MAEPSDIYNEIQFGTLESVQNVLDAVDSNSVNIVDEEGVTPLHAALGFLYLYKFSEVLGMSNPDEPSVLALVQLLLAKGAAETINTEAYEGITPIFVAVDRNFTTIIPILLNNGASSDDLYMPPSFGNKPMLHYFIRYREMETVMTMIGMTNMDLNKQNIQGETALHMAVERSRDLSEDHPDPNESSYREAVAIFDELLLKEVDIDLPDNRGYTPLHLAVYQNKKETVIKLLDNGSDIYKKNNEGESALDMANRGEIWNFFGVDERFVDEDTVSILKVTEATRDAEINNLRCCIKEMGKLFPLDIAFNIAMFNFDLRYITREEIYMIVAPDEKEESLIYIPTQTLFFAGEEDTSSQRDEDEVESKKSMDFSLDIPNPINNSCCIS